MSRADTHLVPGGRSHGVRLAEVRKDSLSLGTEVGGGGGGGRGGDSAVMNQSSILVQRSANCSTE